MDQLVHVNQLIAHAISFIIFLFLVRGAFNAIIFPPMRERRERIRAEFERIEQEKAEVAKIRLEYEGHLKRLEAEGLVRRRGERGSGSPDRHVYRPTARGRKAFADWLRSDALEDDEVTYDFLLGHP